MKRRLRWERQAQRDLAQLERHNPRMAQRVRDAAALYADQERGDVVKLVDRPGVYRLRVGDWRLLFTLEDDNLVIVALRVLNRRDAYR